MLFHDKTGDIGKQVRELRTRHGFLVFVGEVVSRLKVYEILAERVHVKQKTYRFTPADKLVQALLGVLSGCRYMKDMTFGTNPLAGDKAVAKAWGLAGMAHFSTVCTTLSKMAGEQVEELASALGEISRPWLQAAMAKAAGPEGKGLIMIDVDLTGQSVGPDARTSGTAFGYMDGRLAKGYQIAAAYLAGSSDRWAIAGMLKPGNSRSVDCLFELLPRIEAQIGRPRRRVEHVESRLRFLRRQVDQWEKEVKDPHGKGSAARAVTAHRLIESVQVEIDFLERRLLQYLRDNAQGFLPYRLVIRADSAFGTPEAMGLCFEMDYEILVKAATGFMYPALFDAVPQDQWDTDTKSRQVTESLALPKKALPPGCDLRQIGMRHKDRSGKMIRSVLLTTLDKTELPLTRLLHLYRQRQSIEVGFQQLKGAFHFGAPRLRSEAANAAFTQLVLFAYNLVCWCSNLVRDKLPSPKLGLRFLVWVAANAPARVILDPSGSIRIVFAQGTALAGIRFLLPAGP